MNFRIMFRRSIMCGSRCTKQFGVFMVVAVSATDIQASKSTPLTGKHQ
jgi:hypothetical protein